MSRFSELHQKKACNCVLRYIIPTITRSYTTGQSPMKGRDRSRPITVLYWEEFELLCFSLLTITVYLHV